MRFASSSINKFKPLKSSSFGAQSVEWEKNNLKLRVIIVFFTTFNYNTYSLSSFPIFKTQFNFGECGRKVP